ncbi:hypothetical protein D3C73_505090 [compost metagenome]
MYENETFPVQLLGARGSTYQCVEAMITVLTSHNRPSSITIVYDEENHYKEKNINVAFIVREWLQSEITVIPDGFSTTGGTGRWGISICIALIKAANIRIEEVSLKRDVFERLCNAKILKEDLTQFIAPINYENWRLYLREDHEKAIGSGTIWMHIPEVSKSLFSRLPHWTISPELFRQAILFEKAPKEALSSSLVFLEEKIRELSKLDNLFGTPLVGGAFGKNGPLRFNRKDDNEAEGWAAMYMGIFKAIRNPINHRSVELNDELKVRLMLMVDMLYKKLLEEYREKEEKPEEQEDLMDY